VPPPRALRRAVHSRSAVPDGLLRVVRGFQESGVVLTGLELDVFTAVGSGATAEQVSRAC
jgi:hypothetical protein